MLDISAIGPPKPMLQLVETSRAAMLRVPVDGAMHPFSTLPNHGISFYNLLMIPVLFGIILNGLRKARVFRVISQKGPKIILGPEYANEVKSHPACNADVFIAKEFHAHVSGFEVLRPQEVMKDAIRLKLTRSIGALMKPISAETALILETQWGNSNCWHELDLKSTIASLVSRVSAVMFVGEELGRDQKWLSIVTNYSSDMFVADLALCKWPEVLRPIATYFLPSCGKLRRHIREAALMLDPILSEGYSAHQNKQNFLDWLEEIAGGRKYNPVLAQLSLAAAAIDTTSDLIVQTLTDICRFRDSQKLQEDLREEMVRVLRADGWEKSAMYNLKLLDSVLKETQRVKPVVVFGMGRYVTEQITLHDGTVIPKGETINVVNTRVWDPAVYPNPLEWDPYRFVRRRDSGDHAAHLVSPTTDHMGFGLGKHSCPGRFFAATKIKIILCHILLKYDVKISDEASSTVISSGNFLFPDATLRISVRRRQDNLTIWD
ncbi:cytochrome P450 [Aspergillus tetrazonus]